MESAILDGLTPYRVTVTARLAKPGTGWLWLGEQRPTSPGEERSLRLRVANGLPFKIKPCEVTITGAPADLTYQYKLDLAVALAVAEAHGTPLKAGFAVGSLLSDGALRSVRGARIFARLYPAGAILPKINASECTGMTVRTAGTVHDAINGGCLTSVPEPAPPPPLNAHLLTQMAPLFRACVNRVLELVTAGRNVLLFGPPGVGRILLARAVAEQLPHMSADVHQTVGDIYSVTGLPYRGDASIRPPFRAPHHTASYLAIRGGGDIARPGEVSLAHGGILLLDELSEFRRDMLEALIVVIRTKHVEIVAAKRRVTFPADFRCIATMNPCPCGWREFTRPGVLTPCKCSADSVTRHNDRIRPLVERCEFETVIVAPEVYRERRL